MKEFQHEHVKNLPDVYRKDVNSNNYKILQIESSATNGLRTKLQEIESILTVDNATGKTLDLYGERVGQERGAASDQQYLVMIKSKIMQNLCDGTHSSVVNGLAFALSCDPSEIVLVDGEAPCSIKVEHLPLGVINSAGFSSQQVVALIKRMLPCGITLDNFLFEGTFEFCGTEADMATDGATKGFTDVEGGATGGYFGECGGGDETVILPV